MIHGSLGLKIGDFKLARKFAVQFVYQQDVNQQLFMHESTLNNFFVQSEVPLNLREFLKSFLKIVFDSIPKIDAMIEKNTKNWKISRIAKVDLAILRVSIIELIEREDVDAPVILSEAAALAHEFGSTNSPSFVNGILDTLAKEIRKK
jgi:N utilization substance protein B